MNDEVLDLILTDMFSGPLDWSHARDHSWGPVPINLATKLPGAIHKARVEACVAPAVHLTNIAMSLLPPEDFSEMALSQEELDNLKAAVQRVKN